MAELVGTILDVFKFIGSKASKYLKYQREFAEYVGISNKHKLTCVLRRQIFNSNCKTSITLGKSQSKDVGARGSSKLVSALLGQQQVSSLAGETIEEERKKFAMENRKERDKFE
ncbi:hypothetical protein Gogos_015676 [Gossypium gossypioides]|uniref:Uncharacterized protein n=1 Tax=Gossypium gossypioides TaxID=34282 RepID=A0A7J9C2K4_GOSGO|nr:hypothetical protein [Gossypium gossypioides]